MAASAYFQDVQKLYIAYYQRPADPAGLLYWAQQIDAAGGSTAGAVNAFGLAAESQALYGDVTSATIGDVIDKIYTAAFNRPAEAAGKAYWVEQFNAGAISASGIAYAVVLGAQNTDLAVSNAKLAVANEFTKQVDGRPLTDPAFGTAPFSVTYAGDTDANSARTILKPISDTVTLTPAEVTQALKDKIADPSDPIFKGGTFTLTTNVDTLIGTSGNDTFTGTAATYVDADRVIDASTTDVDTYNLTIAASAVPDVTNVEKINVTTAATGALTISANKMSGVKELTVTTGDLSVGGSTIAGSKTVTVDKLLADKVAKVVTGAGVKVFTLDQTQATATDSKAGVEIDATTVTGNITVTGAATLNADNAAAATGEQVIVKAINGAAAAENAKAVTINAAKALDVEVNDNTGVKFTGAITVNAAAAKEVQVQSASGGVTINAAKAADNAGNGIVVAGIDDSGATITTGSFGSLKTDGTIDKQGKISVDGTAAGTDVATITAGGYIGLTTNATQQVDILNLSGNGAAVQYAITGAATTYNLTGDQNVTLAGDEASFDGKTVTDSTTAGTTAVKITTLNDSDLSKVAVDKIIVASNVASKTLTVANNANIELASDIGTKLTISGKNTDSIVNVSIGDDTNASGAAITIESATFDFATNIKTVNLDATVGAYKATSATTLAATATLNVTGSKDVALGTVIAKEVLAGSATGKVSLTAAGATTAKTITTGTGADAIVLNQTLKFTVDAGNGDNDITITDVDTATSVATGSGADKVAINDDSAIVVVTGAGDDTVTIGSGVVTDAIIVMGDGTADKLVFGGAMDLKAKDNYAVTGVEIVDVTAANGTVKVKASAFAQDNTFKLVGDSATADIFHVLNNGTAGATIDASGVTFNATQDAALYLEGAAKLADTITGSAKNDTIVATSGADVVNGGEGVDTITFATGFAGVVAETGGGTVTGMVVNLGTSAVTNTSILAATGGFTANSITSVDGGKTAYLFGAAASTNSAVQQTLSSIENVVGTAGRDYIVGSANDNVITGGVGGDFINVGVGTDTIKLATLDDSSKVNKTSAVSGTVTIDSGYDVVLGMGVGDKIDVSSIFTTDITIGNALLTSAVAADAAAIVRGKYDATAGTWAAGSTDATFNDYLLQVSDGTSITSVLLVDVVGVLGTNTDASGVFTLVAAV